jgi:hypothetical protein
MRRSPHAYLHLKNIVRQWSLIIGKSVGSIWRLILGWRFLGGSMRDENTMCIYVMYYE